MRAGLWLGGSDARALSLSLSLSLSLITR
jgi:hypothetical protein